MNKNHDLSTRNLIIQGTENILSGIIKGEFNCLIIDTECFSKTRTHNRNDFMNMIKEEIKCITGKDVDIDEELVINHINYLVEEILVNVTFLVDDNTVSITVNRDE